MNAGCQVYYPDILRKEVRPLLHELKQMGLQVALASSSSRECIEQVLTQCKIRELFDCIVSGHEFTHSKPDPEIYRFTMDKLRRKPEECLIVEDSTYGVQAGTAAGGVVAAAGRKISVRPAGGASAYRQPCRAACAGGVRRKKDTRRLL